MSMPHLLQVIYKIIKLQIIYT